MRTGPGAARIEIPYNPPGKGYDLSGGLYAPPSLGKRFGDAGRFSLTKARFFFFFFFYFFFFFFFYFFCFFVSFHVEDGRKHAKYRACRR